MSIFGVAGPKFVYDHGGPGEVTVLIDYWTTTKSEPDTSYVEQISELDLETDLIKRGTHFVFEGYTRLYKYGLPEPLNMSSIQAKYDEIVQYHGMKVSLWRHRDGEQFRKGSNDVLFYLTETIPFNLKTPDFKDALILKFRSAGSIDSSLGAAPIIQPNEIIMTSKLVT